MANSALPNTNPPQHIFLFQRNVDGDALSVLLRAASGFWPSLLVLVPSLQSARKNLVLFRAVTVREVDIDHSSSALLCALVEFFSRHKCLPAHVFTAGEGSRHGKEMQLL